MTDLDEGAIVATFAEQDKGSYSKRVLIPVLKFCFWSKPVSCCSHSLKVYCDAFASDKYYCLFWDSENPRGKCSVLLRHRANFRALRNSNTGRILGHACMAWEIISQLLRFSRSKIGTACVRRRHCADMIPITRELHGIGYHERLSQGKLILLADCPIWWEGST